MSVYERMQNMQEKHPEIIDGAEFVLNVKSCFNLPKSVSKPKIRRIRVMKDPDDE